MPLSRCPAKNSYIGAASLYVTSIYSNSVGVCHVCICLVLKSAIPFFLIAWEPLAVQQCEHCVIRICFQWETKMHEFAKLGVPQGQERQFPKSQNWSIAEVETLAKSFVCPIIIYFLLEFCLFCWGFVCLILFIIIITIYLFLSITCITGVSCQPWGACTLHQVHLQPAQLLQPSCAVRSSWHPCHSLQRPHRHQG